MNPSLSRVNSETITEGQALVNTDLSSGAWETISRLKRFRNCEFSRWLLAC